MHSDKEKLYIAQEVWDQVVAERTPGESDVVDAIQEGLHRIMVEQEQCDPIHASRVAYNVAQTIEKDFPLYEHLFAEYLRSK